MFLMVELLAWHSLYNIILQLFTLSSRQINDFINRFVLITCILMQITFKDDLIFVILADVEVKLLFDVLFIYSIDH
jgi:hypothetical protein